MPRGSTGPALALCVVLSGCASAPPADPPSRPAETGSLTVQVTGFADDSGQALVAVFLDERGWPGDQTLAFGRAVLQIVGGEAQAAFADVPAGPFAVSVFHDKDLDRELDANVLRMPTEPYGFSRDARGTFGPPGFDEARLDLLPGEVKQVTVRVR
ncbi:MAG TPA: DUF2141 domain-containing protein [Vicinamibacterales bacterium]|nr:DUF2141 domain-containing protein [Vicinamibacterales bacterium]